MKGYKWIVSLIVLLVTVTQWTGAQENRKFVVSSTSWDNPAIQKVEKGTSLKQVLSRIEREFNVKFFYKSGLLAGKNLSKQQYLYFERGLFGVLDELLPEFGFAYKTLTHRTLGIIPKHEALQSGIIQEVITGQVTDASTGQTLPGVNVLVKGTTTGTATDSDGTYELEVESLQDTLVFSFIGYQSREVPVNGRTTIDVALRPQAITGEELVVVGYGVQSVETTTGSYSQVSGEELEIEPTTNLTQSLKGTMTGVFGVETTGRPGQDDVGLLIRGQSTFDNPDLEGDENAPLVVIDGVPARQGGLSRLNPSDIENVSVIKDGTASIYGARAANGVILVQTKGGRTGETRIDVGYERSFNRPAIVPDMADAATFMEMLNEIDQVRGNPPRYSQESIEEHRNCPADSFTCFNTDWYDAGLKNFSSQNKVNASVTGGIESLRYRVSLQGLNEDGILKNSGTGYNQVGFRTNLDGDVSESVLLTFGLHGRWEKRDLPAWTRGLNSAWEMLQRGKPNEPAFWPTGEPGPAQEQGVNPVVSDRTGFQNEETWFFQSNLNVEVDIPTVEGWSVEGTVAYDQQFNNFKRFQKPWTLYEFGGRDANGDPILTPVEVGVADPNLTQEQGTTQDVLLRGTTNYITTFAGDHNVRALLGTEYQWQEGNTLWAFRRFFPTDRIPELFAGGQPEQNNTGSSFEQKRLSFFGRLNYNYKEKYLFEFVGRYDGSYIFPEGDRFGFFPTVSVGWRLNQEDWFDDFTGGFFDRLKLRASFGQVGNDRVNPFQFLRTFGFADEQFAFGDGVVPRLEQNRVPNPNITWEVSTKFDVGFETGFLDERLTFDVVYFRENRDDILITAAEEIPQTTGFTLPDQNIGKVRSRGIESQIKYAQHINPNITLRAGANISWAKNEIDFIAEPAAVLPWQSRTGNPMNTDLIYVADGIWNTQQEIDNADAHWPSARPGDIRFKDINGDGQINGDDRVRLEEDGVPDIIGALNLGASIRQFDVSLQFQGAARVQHNVFTASVGEFGNYFQEFAENRWTPENTDASGPRAFNRVDPYWATNMSTFWYRDAKYLRLKRARITYTVPVTLSQRLGVDRFQIYASGRNLITFTPLEIGDPEIRIGGAQTYPPERQIAIGFQMSF